MIVVRIILKLACLPFLLVLCLVKWFCLFVTAVSSVFFVLLAVILFITGVLSYGFGLESGSESLRIIIAGFVMFMIPVIAAWVVAGIDTLKGAISDFVWS